MIHYHLLFLVNTTSTQVLLYYINTNFIWPYNYGYLSANKGFSFYQLICGKSIKRVIFR